MDPIQTRTFNTGGAARIQLAQASEPAPVVTVNIRNMRFELPANFTVRPGTEVEFVNLDRMPHTVTARNTNAAGAPLFDVRLRPNERKRFTFTADHLGTQPFFCIFHPNMTGTLTVSAAQAAHAIDSLDGSADRQGVVQTVSLTPGLAEPRVRLPSVGARS